MPSQSVKYFCETRIFRSRAFQIRRMGRQIPRYPRFIRVILKIDEGGSIKTEAGRVGTDGAVKNVITPLTFIDE